MNQSLHTKIIHTKPEPYCPDCGAIMVLRRPGDKQVWEPFWGCNRFPDCKGTRSIDEHGKPVMKDSELEDA